MPSVTSISPTASLTPSATSQTPNATQTLNQADFLKLLVTQMTSQDPLSPVSDTDMAAQMAQFSALQAAQSTDSDVRVLQANTLIGRTVSVNSTSGAAGTGVVTAVQIQAGTPEVMVNGQSYDLSQISEIVPTSTTSATPTTN